MDALMDMLKVSKMVIEKVQQKVSQLVTLTVPMKDLKMAILMVNLMEHVREPQMVMRLDNW